MRSEYEGESDGLQRRANAKLDNIAKRTGLLERVKGDLIAFKFLTLLVLHLGRGQKRSPA